MNISQIKEAIKIIIKAELPVFLHGPPGVGKTELIKQLAEELDRQFLGINGPLLNPVDLMGLPYEEKGITKWARPEILPSEGKGILLIDEVPDSPPLLLKAYYSLILEHRVQSHRIPMSWQIIGAGNRPEDKAMAGTMPSPLITRFIHLGVCCPVPDFTNQTVEKAEVDEKDFLAHAENSNFHPLIIAYLSFRINNCYSHQAVPRTWEYVSKLLYSAEDKLSFVFECILQGTIGVNIGREFSNFIKLSIKVPNINLILQNPEESPIPEEKDVRMALIAALIRTMKEDTVEPILKYGLRLEKESQVFMFNHLQRTKEIAISHPLFIKWKNDNKDILV